MHKKLNTFQRVRELEGWQAVAFSAALLERMLPNYQLFCELMNFGDAVQYRNTLNNIWDSLSHPKSKINFAVQLEKVESAVPDASNFDNFGVYPAIDACIAMSATIQLILKEDLQGAVVVSKLSQGGVEAYIEASSESALQNTEIKAHPLMQWEIALQTQLLDEIAQVKRNAVGCQQLKCLALAEGISNIGIEITDLPGVEVGQLKSGCANQ